MPSRTTATTSSIYGGGKITSVWVNEDSLGLMRQLGVLPSGGPSAPATEADPGVVEFVLRTDGATAEGAVGMAGVNRLRCPTV